MEGGRKGVREEREDVEGERGRESEREGGREAGCGKREGVGRKLRSEVTVIPVHVYT